MKIAHIEIFEVALPMSRALKTGFGNISNKHELIVKLITEDGLVGYGESASLDEPIYNPETTESCKLILTEYIAPAVIGKSFETAEEFREAYAHVVGNHIAKAGIECAFWHLMSQHDGRSLKSLFGGVKTEIAVGEGVSIKASLTELLDDVQQNLDRGFRRIKVKIKPGWDVEPLQAIRDRWPDIELSADANAAYRFETHAKLLQSLDRFSLSMLEQPLDFDDFVDHAALQDSMKTPICLDESIQSLNDARTAITLGSCQVINIKPSRVGGIVEALKIHDYSAAHGVSVWCGGMLETGVGRAFNLALASKSNFRHPADMSPLKSFYKDDITDPPLMLKSNGCMDVPDEPGMGFRVNDNKLQKYTVNKIVI
jgi:o-succinylbenzoate synthase